MDIWSNAHSTAASQAGQKARLGDQLAGYDPLATFNATMSNPAEYKQSFSNVELDPLAFQMMQLNAKDSLSQLTTPSMMQNSIFSNSSMPLNNRQLSDNTMAKLTGSNTAQNSSTGNANNGNNSNINFNSNWQPNHTNNSNSNSNSNVTANANANSNSNPSNTNANTNSNNSNPYTNYLIQQAQAQAQAQAQVQSQQQAVSSHPQSLSQPSSHHNSFSAQMNYKRSQSNAQQSSQNRPTGSNGANYIHQQQSHNYNNTNTNNSNNIATNTINSFQNENIKPQNLYNMDPRALKPSNQFKNSMNINDPSEIETYRSKLQLKDIIINKLESELEKMKQFQSTILKAQNDSNGNYEIPKNYEDLYLKLVEKIQATESELDDTKTRLEALVTAIAMNPNPSTFKNGRYDEEEISHKIISKLKMLTEENDELARMVSYGKSKEKDIEIALLRKQNNDLLEKVAKLENKLNDKK